MKLGKLPARTDSIKLKLSNYLDKKAVPKPPSSFGHESVVKSWGMLANDSAGCCVFAGAAHETMLWGGIAGHQPAFSDRAVLSDYSAVTGFDPSKPDTDQGTDMQQAAAYRQKVGIVDASGTRHKVAAYVAIAPGDLQEHLLALWLFGAVGIGIEFPGSAMSQFNSGKPWGVVKGSAIEGGHYIPLVCRRNRQLSCVTWGAVQRMTDSFFRKYNDESVAYVSEEMLVGGKSLEGFDRETLLADLKVISK